MHFVGYAIALESSISWVPDWLRLGFFCFELIISYHNRDSHIRSHLVSYEHILFLCYALNYLQSSSVFKCHNQLLELLLSRRAVRIRTDSECLVAL